MGGDWQPGGSVRGWLSLLMYILVLPRLILLVVIVTLMLQTGVIQFFKEMDIGSLDIGDFLGICPYHSLIFQPGFVHVWVSYYFSLQFSAIGAIFAATDSVCTLQVCIN